VTLPEVGSCSPDAILRSVDLSHPDGPTIVTNSPLSTVNDTSRTASAPSGKTIPIPSNDNDSTSVPSSGKDICDHPKDSTHIVNLEHTE
jgi:hypothetical protein